MFQTKFGWSDFFSGSPATTLGPGYFNSRQTPSVSSIYVSNCLFNGCTSGSYGGALYCSSSVTYLLVESSSFFSCKTSDLYGGAIYFYNTGSGQCVLYDVCGYDCYSSYSGTSYRQFAYMGVNNVVSSNNYVNYSSISRCGNMNSGSRYALYHDYGKICYISVNISMNKCNYYSGIYCYPSSDSSSATCSLLYCSFTDNSASQCTCIWFNRAGAKYEIKCCNILRNTQVTNTHGTIYTNGILNIEDSCILENTASTIFDSTSSSYPITLTNCTVDKTTNNGYLTIRNTVTKSFILALNHMSTRNCHSEYDSAGFLTAIPHVSDPIKKIFCYTCKIYHCQGRISILFSIIQVFIFTFIHPNPIV
jgi:hypothetical protein